MVTSVTIISVLHVILLSCMGINNSEAKPSIPNSTTTKASFTKQLVSTNAENGVALLTRFVNALFFDGFGNGNDKDRVDEEAYDKWENDLFNFNPKSEPFTIKSILPHRKLTPIDLTKPFIFDDSEEIATANSTNMDLSMVNIDFLEERSTLPRPTEGPYDFEIGTLVTTTEVPVKKNFILGTIDFIGGKVQRGASTIQGLIVRPLWFLKSGGTPHSDSVEDQDTELKIEENSMIVKRTATMTEQKSLIFPDDPEYTGMTGVVSNSTHMVVSKCREQEVLYNSKCETLFLQGPCETGEHLVEDDDTEEIKCAKTNCRYPDTALLRETNTCVMLKYHACPSGMRLIIVRSGNAVCDCRPGFIYFGKENKCYEAYRQGPCRHSQYFILPKSDRQRDVNNSDSGEPNDQIPPEPKCVRNPCKRTDFVCYGETCPIVQRRAQNCFKLNTVCPNENGILVVNEKTLQLECRTAGTFQTEIGTRILSQIPELSCAPGTKRDIEGKCRKTFRFKKNGK